MQSCDSPVFISTDCIVNEKLFHLSVLVINFIDIGKMPLIVTVLNCIGFVKYGLMHQT
jgi:hypothetical protein